MNNFLIRTITGSLFVILVVASLLLGQYTYLSFSGLVIFLSMLEFYRLAKLERTSAQVFLGIAGGLALFFLSWLIMIQKLEIKSFILLLPFIFFIFIAELFRNRRKPFANIAYTITGMIYIALPFSFFHAFVYTSGNQMHYNPYLLLGIFILMWVFDSCAYLVGVTIGKRRLFERISPKKSWEGFIGGILLTLPVAWFYASYSGLLHAVDWLAIALIVSVFGTLGDLIESMFKRSLGTKDSGKILPGHGGILDRFDGIFISSPMIYLYLQFIV